MNARKNFVSAGWRLGFLFFTVLLAAGCTAYQMTNPPRSVTEQLLLSTASDRALQTANFGIFANQKVFVDASCFESYDSKYALGEIRDVLSRAGARLVDNVTNCDDLIEVRSGALSTDQSESLVGLPKTTAPVPLAGVVALPEVALYKSQKQHSIAKLALLAYARQTREHVFSSGPLVGKAYNNYYKFLFAISWTTTDIPEKHKKQGP